MKRYIRYASFGILTMLLGVALCGCIKNFEPCEDNGSGDTVGFRLKLDIPGLAAGSRAMTDEQETAIDYGTIQVLIFEETAGGDVFHQKATITDQKPPVITVLVPKSKAAEKYRLVLVANMPEPAGITAGMTKSDVMNLFLFDCIGAWDTSAGGAYRIPMWGETDSSFAITKDMFMGMLLHRALARVDVGLLFKFNNPDPATGLDYPDADTDKESVWGLDDFNINSIRVYRMRDQAYAASSSDKMSGTEVITPNIPASAQFNSSTGTVATLALADQYPLLYTLGTAGESYVREIYVPESSVIDAGSGHNNVPCLVVGGYYGAGNTTVETFYRADFATYGNGAVQSYRPILRNHRYVFDIRSVSGPGSPTPEDALNSINSQLNLNVVDWNEKPLNFYDNKHYFWDIEKRSVVLEAYIPFGAAENSVPISYDTDLILNGSTPEKSITYHWSNNDVVTDFFDVRIDYVNQTISIIAKEDNTGLTAVPRSDVLTVMVEDLTFDINVTQKASNLLYTPDCSSVQVRGKYLEGVTLNYTHYITMTVTSPVDIAGEEYDVKTNTQNGISFSSTGIFASVAAVGGLYTYTLTLLGEGTLVNESGADVLTSFDMQIMTNSIDDAYCTATIVIGYRTKKILTIGANAIYRYGYMLEPNSASRAMVDATINFGSNPESTVTMETNANGNAFTIEVMTAGTGMIGEVIQYNYLRNMLETFQPDIILTGQSVNYNASGGDAIQLLSDFVDAGGVFLMCNEYYPIASSITAMVSKIMGPVSGNNQSIGYNQLFTISSDDPDDPIVNGPFGNMQGLQWGADGHEMFGFTGLPAGTIIYSRRSGDGVPGGAVCMFRHPTKGFFFMGEGGFISNNRRYIGGAYQGDSVYFPFAIDALYRPIPRTNYTLARNATVYNSQIFANLLTWAVDYSENH